MAEYELSNKADDDLNVIYLFSRQRFGEAKADAYLLAL
jgi:plasmid stabilization system protein ParE